MNPDGTPTIDLAGNYLDTYQTINGVRHYYNPSQNYVNYGFGRVPIGNPLAGLQDFQNTGQSFAPTIIAPDFNAAASLGPAPIPPQFIFSFDTIGQVIFRSIGHCRLPLRTIWAQGINESGDSSTSPTQTFAAALCAPIDPDEEIDILTIWDAGHQVYAGGLALSPLGWSAEDIAALNASIAGMVVYPGDESQLPAPLIVADKGADKTNAFRGIRYIIFPDYPLRGGPGGGGSGGGGGGGGIPPLSIAIQRTNPGGTPSEDSFGAVEFLSGGS